MGGFLLPARPSDLFFGGDLIHPKDPSLLPRLMYVSHAMTAEGLQKIGLYATQTLFRWFF